MQEVLNIISLIIVSVGGTGAVVLGISGFIGKIWINKFAEMYEFDVKYNESFVACRDLKMTVAERKELDKKQKKLTELRDELLEKIRGYLNKLKLV